MPAFEAAAKVRRHLEHCDQYFANGREALDKGEAAKAGELFWGSAAQAFHALAAAQGVAVERHRRLKNFVIYVSDAAGDPQILGGFLAAEILHKGFYDVDVEPGDVEAGLPLIRYTIAAVRGLIPGDLK